MITTRTQKILIKKNNEYWKQIDELSLAVKNLYNMANYIVRQEFIKTSKEKQEGLVEKAHYITGYDLCYMLKNAEQFKVVGSSIGQGTLKLLDKNWKSYFATIKDWKKNKERYTGMPKMPGYLDKEKGRCVIKLCNQSIKNQDGYVYFGYKFLKNMNNTFKTIRPEKIYSARIVPRLPNYVLEIIYQIEVPEESESSERIASIDLGVNNLMTVVNNCEEDCFVVNGKPLKSINQYYNKVKAEKQSSLMIKNGKHYSNAINNLTAKRNRKVEDYIHKSSRYVVDWCVDHNIDTLICGHNDGWKQGSDMGKTNNQNFISIPHTTLIKQLKYKCEDKGIKFVEVKESYTSGTSFLDNEEPIKENYDKSRRVERGLFVANDGTQINADVNGAYQIMRKAFPNVVMQDVRLHPKIINI